MSRHLADADAWPNSVLLRGDAVETVAALGSGARLFDGPAPLTESELTGSVTTGKGVIIAHYARR